MFMTLSKTNFSFESPQFCRLQILLVWIGIKYCCLVNSYCLAKNVSKRFLNTGRMLNLDTYSPLTSQSRLLTSGKRKLLKTLWKKRENAGNQHFFLQYFLSFLKQISNFESHLFCRLQMLRIWTSLKFCRLVKSLLVTK